MTFPNNQYYSRDNSVQTADLLLNTEQNITIPKREIKNKCQHFPNVFRESLRVFFTGIDCSYTYRYIVSQ
jgi:hypothetical protein